MPEGLRIDKSYLSWCDEALIKKIPATFAPFHSAKTQASSVHDRVLQVGTCGGGGKTGTKRNGNRLHVS